MNMETILEAPVSDGNSSAASHSSLETLHDSAPYAIATVEDVLRFCDKAMPLILNYTSFNLSFPLPELTEVHLKCDNCPLNETQLDILYSDQTCIKSRFEPLTLLCVLYSITFVLGLTGNWLVLWAVVTGGRALSSVMHLFIVNLAVGDLLMVVLCVPATVVSVIVLHYWPFGEVLCVGISYLQAVSVFVSAYSLVAISLDRYMAIIYPLRPRITRHQAWAVIAAVWMFAFLTCVPIARYSELQVPDEGYHLHHNVAVCNERWPSHLQALKQGYAYALLVLHYFLPVAVMIFTYSRIAWRVWGSKESETVRAFKAYSQISRPDDRKTTKIGCDAGAVAPFSRTHSSVRHAAQGDHSPAKMIRMTVTVVLVYSLCWLPFNVLMVLHDLLRDVPGFHMAWAACHWLAMSHTVFNPLILYWLNTTFRVAVLKMLRRWLPSCCYGWMETNLEHASPQRLHRSTTCTTSCGIHNCSLHHSLHRHHGATYRRAHATTARFSAKRSFSIRHCDDAPEAMCVPLNTLQQHRHKHCKQLQTLGSTLQLQSLQLPTTAESDQQQRCNSNKKQDQLDCGSQKSPKMDHILGSSDQLHNQNVKPDHESKKSLKLTSRDSANKLSWYDGYKNFSPRKRDKIEEDRTEFCSDECRLRIELETSISEVSSKTCEQIRSGFEGTVQVKRSYLSPFSSLISGKDAKRISHSAHLEDLAKNCFIIENKTALDQNVDPGADIRTISKSDTNLSLGLSACRTMGINAMEDHLGSASTASSVKAFQARESSKIISLEVGHPGASQANSLSLQQPNLTLENATAQLNFSQKPTPLLVSNVLINKQQDSVYNRHQKENDFAEKFDSEPTSSDVKVRRNSSQETAATDNDEDDWSESEIILPDSELPRFAKATTERGCRV